MNVITIQHTESEHHLNGMVGSWFDWGLTELGLEHARNIVNNISRIDGIENVDIYSSDLIRCKTIAMMMGESIGVQAEFIQLLRGKNYGSACGKTDQWLERNRLPFLESDSRDLGYRYVEDAENTIDLYNRVIPVFDQILAKGRSFILVGHGDTLNIFFAYWLGATVEQMRHADIFCQPGGVSFFKRLSSGKKLAHRIGDMSFIEKHVSETQLKMHP